MTFLERARELVSKMTLEEKLARMRYDAPAIERLGVPAYNWWNECLHGVARQGCATVFPQAIGLASSFNTELMHKVATAISDEARAKYNEFKRFGSTEQYQGLTFWSPNINIFRDPRWGRGHETYVATFSWTPMYAPEHYTALPYQVKDTKFIHYLSPKDHNRFAIFKTTPMVNDVITDVSIELIDKASLGDRDQLDMIAIGYTLAPYTNGTVQKYGMELQDAYVRLDANLERLFKAIDSSVGLDKAVVYITSTGYFAGEGREPSFYKIQSGEFYPKRAVSLLNMYMMALYGAGDWVTGYSHNQIYLNRELIKDRNIEIEEARDKAAQFLIDMEGVQDVYTQHRILLRSTSEHTDRLRRGLSSTLSGDIFIELVPGWEIVYEDPSNTRQYIRYNAVSTPFMLMAPNVSAQKIEHPIDVTSIAPTISRVLRIRAPNGCTTRPLDIVYK